VRSLTVPPGPLCRPLAALLLAAATAAVAAADPEPEPPADLATKLGGMFAAGQYRQALAESEPLEKELKPRGRDPQLIPRTKLWVDLLAFRASIERRLGNIDTAAEKYEAAFKALADKDLRRNITLVLRGGDKAAGLLVPLELTNAEVLDGRADVLLDALAAPEGEGEAADRPQPAEAIAAAREAVALARAAREGLEERMSLADKAVRQSPTALMLASMSRPLRAAGRLALAESRLAGTLPERPAADERAAPERAVASLDEAIAVAEAAMAPALPKPPRGADVAVPPPAPAAGSPADFPSAVREAGLVRADLLAWRAQARRAAGDPVSARADLAAAVAWRRAVQGDEHPDLLEPLTWLADLALAEARTALGRHDIAESERWFAAAAAALDEAGTVATAQREQFGETSPLPGRVAALVEAVGRERQEVAGRAGDANAVDAAAARVLRLLDSLPPEGDVPPRPR
jgi:tetratricopeptide (TPR) repeat protein